MENAWRGLCPWVSVREASSLMRSSSRGLHLERRRQPGTVRGAHIRQTGQMLRRFGGDAGSQDAGGRRPSAWNTPTWSSCRSSSSSCWARPAPVQYSPWTTPGCDVTPITALQAVMEAGGFDFTRANTKAVRVVRNDRGRTTNTVLNLKQVLGGAKGDDAGTAPAKAASATAEPSAPPTDLNDDDIPF